MGVQYKEALEMQGREEAQCVFRRLRSRRNADGGRKAGAKPARGREKEPPAAGRETAGFHALSAEERMCRTLRLLSILRPDAFRMRCCRLLRRWVRFIPGRQIEMGLKAWGDL